MITTFLSLGLIRGVLTLLLMLAFIGMVVHVYSRRNRETYDAAAAMPLEDDSGDKS
jgi:cytochrome c oxidase cbb3-type subunit 4